MVIPIFAKLKFLNWREKCSLHLWPIYQNKIHSLRHSVATPVFPDVVDELLRAIEAARTELGDVDMIGTDQRLPPMEDPNRL